MEERRNYDRMEARSLLASMARPVYTKSIVGYVLVRCSDGAYVAPLLSKRSYVRLLSDARVFRSLEDAERELIAHSEFICPLERMEYHGK